MNKFHLSQLGYICGCVLIIGLGIGTLWYSYLDVSQQVHLETETTLSLQSSLKGEMIEQTLLGSIRHARFIYSTPPISGIVASFNVLSERFQKLDDYERWVNRLETIFVAYIQNNPDIVQMRFIGEADLGKELVRVQRQGANVEVVPEEKLQHKNQRNYFQHTRTLPPEQLYISGITLNREYGKIEQPSWPTYRIAQPVYDQAGRFFGLVIINFNAQLLLDKLNQHTPDYLALFLLNEKGQYLLHPHTQMSFSFEHAQSSTWQEDAEPVERHVFSEKIQTVRLAAQSEIYHVSEYPIAIDVKSHVPPLTIITAVNNEHINTLIMQRYSTSVLFNMGLIALALILLTLYRLYSHASYLRLKIQAEIEAIFQGSNDIIISMDKNGIVDSWNHTALHFFSKTDDEMRHANVEQLVLEDEAVKAIKRHINNTFKGVNVEPLEISFGLKSAKERVMSVAFSPVRIGGKVSSVSAIFRDVTDATLLRQSLQQSNQKLAFRNEEMQAFVYTVSHDLKSPLVTIGGFAERIQESIGESLDEKNQHRLNRIKVNVNHMAQLLSELLDLARIVRQKLQLEKCQLNTCIETAQQSLNQTILESNARFEIENGEQYITVNGQLVTQCLQNLFSNAINYAQPDRPIVIKVRCYIKDQMTYVAVSDNGMGIDKKYHAKVFKIFERLDIGSGSGVGLAIVKTIMDKHQGWVTLESTIGKGSTFTLCFPQSAEI